MKGEAWGGDPVVLGTIRLLQHRRAVDRLLDTAATCRAAVAAGELEKMPPLAPAPPMPEVVPVPRHRTTMRARPAPPRRWWRWGRGGRGGGCGRPWCSWRRRQAT